MEYIRVKFLYPQLSATIRVRNGDLVEVGHGTIVLIPVQPGLYCIDAMKYDKVVETTHVEINIAVIEAAKQSRWDFFNYRLEVVTVED